MARPPKYNCNEKYFDVIRSQNQAYILGFIWADGSINPRSGLSICIKRDDKEVLEFIRRELQCDVPIKDLSEKYSKFTLNRVSIIKALMHLGLTSNKSQNNAKIPRIKKLLIRHFLRGLFDGDGSIWENTGFRANFSGGHDFLVWVRDILTLHKITCNPIRFRHKGNFNGCSLPITGRANIDKLRNLLYTKSRFHLKRKFERFERARLTYENKDKSDWRLNGTKNNIRELLLQGKFSTEIAKLLGIGYGSVRYMVSQVRNDKV
jgi:hypothetical protein